MRVRGLAWIVGMLLVGAICGGAQAAPLIYTVSGTFADGGVLSGTLTAYPQQGYFPYANLTVFDPAAPAFLFFGTSRDLGFSGYPSGDPAGFYPDSLYFGSNPYQAQLELVIPVPSPLLNYPGGPLCSDTSDPVNCIFTPSGKKSITSIRFPQSSVYAHDGYSVDLTSGSITLTSGTLPGPVPEPPSLVMLASGLLGLARMARERMRRAYQAE